LPGPAVPAQTGTPNGIMNSGTPNAVQIVPPPGSVQRR
jgi:hypothetical protein